MKQSSLAAEVDHAQDDTSVLTDDNSYGHKKSPPKTSSKSMKKKSKTDFEPLRFFPGEITAVRYVKYNNNT
jgi:hypothetical protein